MIQKDNRDDSPSPPPPPPMSEPDNNNNNNIKRMSSTTDYSMRTKSIDSETVIREKNKNTYKDKVSYHY